MGSKIKEATKHIKDLDLILNETIQSRILKHDIKPLTKIGDNWGSEMISIEITTDDDENNTHHLVGKLIPPTEEQMKIFNIQMTFKNEIGFYADIIPALEDFQEKYGQATVGAYFPKMYGARVSLDPKSDVVDTDGVIIMENLKTNGYYNIDRHEGFDLEAAKKILHALADFQAIVVALRKTQPEIFDSKIKPYLSEWKAPEDPYLNFDVVLRENPNTAHLIPRVQKMLNKERIKEIREPWATITHNDLWINNIMVKESNGNLNSLKFIDFQMSDYGSPLTDVLFFLLSSVKVPVLLYHFDKLLKYYYDEFIKKLQSFNVDLKEFTYISFLEEVKKEASYQSRHVSGMYFIIFAPKIQPELDNIDDMIFPFPTPMKEHIWFLVEEGTKRDWF